MPRCDWRLLTVGSANNSFNETQDDAEAVVTWWKQPWAVGRTDSSQLVRHVTLKHWAARLYFKDRTHARGTKNFVLHETLGCPEPLHSNIVPVSWSSGGNWGRSARCSGPSPTKPAHKNNTSPIRWHQKLGRLWKTRKKKLGKQGKTREKWKRNIKRKQSGGGGVGRKEKKRENKRKKMETWKEKRKKKEKVNKKKK